MKKQKLILLLLIANLYFLDAQNTKLIDSLKTELAKRKTDDSVKVIILTRLHEKLMFSKPEEARAYAEQELKISKKINYKRGMAVSYMHLGNYYGNKTENDSATLYYKKAKNMFAEINEIRGLIFVNHSLSDITRIQGNLDEAIKITKETLELIKEHEKEGDLKTKFIGAQHNALANIYIEKGDYQIALNEALKSLKCFEDINHETRKADVLKQIGDIESGLENHEASIDYFKQAIEIYERFEDKIYAAYAYNSLGISYQNLKDYQNATKNYDKAISYSREVEDNLSLSNALHNQAELEIIKNNYAKAKTLLLDAKNIAEKEDLKLGLVNIYDGLSQIDYQSNSFSGALINNSEAIEIAKKIGALSHLKDLYKYRSKILQSLNRNDEAINHLTAYQKLNDSLFSIKKIQQIEELKTIYQTEKKEAEIAFQQQEIKTLNKEVEISNLRKGLYAGGMFTFLAISGLLYFGFKQRMKKNKIEREKQEEIYKQEIEFKKKELASQTLHLVQKNTFIQELKDNLEKIKQSPELFKVEFRRLVMLLKKESAEDKDWEVFKSYFSEVHNNFDIKLKEVYNDISEKEIRLAFFLRMNLSTKEIASMLNVLPDSILKSKYRLKKKLNLDKETDLNQFLNTL